MYQVIFDLSTKKINILVAKDQKIIVFSFKKLKISHSDGAINYFFNFLKEKKINFLEISEIIITQFSGSITGNLITFSLITCWKYFNEKTKFYLVDSLYLQMDCLTKISAFNDVKKKVNFLIFNNESKLFEKVSTTNEEFFQLQKKYLPTEIQINNQRNDFLTCFFANANKYKRPIQDDYFCFRS